LRGEETARHEPFSLLELQGTRHHVPPVGHHRLAGNDLGTVVGPAEDVVLDRQLRAREGEDRKPGESLARLRIF
jgi:hypothetical protein